jgi:hypothetical protein
MYNTHVQGGGFHAFPSIDALAAAPEQALRDLGGLAGGSMASSLFGWWVGLLVCFLGVLRDLSGYYALPVYYLLLSLLLLTTTPSICTHTHTSNQIIHPPPPGTKTHTSTTTTTNTTIPKKIQQNHRAGLPGQIHPRDSAETAGVGEGGVAVGASAEGAGGGSGVWVCMSGRVGGSMMCGFWGGRGGVADACVGIR